MLHASFWVYSKVQIHFTSVSTGFEAARRAGFKAGHYCSSVTNWASQKASKPAGRLQNGPSCKLGLNMHKNVDGICLDATREKEIYTRLHVYATV